jgi:hypothetical protein
MDWGFNVGFLPEPLKGRPKLAILERTEHRIEARTSRIESSTEYNADGTIAGRQEFAPDGSLRMREVSEYAADGRLHSVQSFDSSGKALGGRRVRYLAQGEESEILDGTGNVLERTMVKLDTERRPVEATTTDVAGGSVSRMLVRYETNGDIEARVDLPGYQLHIVQSASGESVVIHPADGDTETIHAGLRREGDAEIIGIAGTQRREVVEARDEHGNWTRKSVFTGDPVGGSEVITESFHRALTYY